MIEPRPIFRRTLVVASIALALLAPIVQGAGTTAYLGDTGDRGAGSDSSAVDARGVRHSSRKYGRNLPPWFHDRVKTFAPDYPYRDRAQRNEGRGLFRLSLDLSTGTVTRVTMLKSTGFVTLDRSTIAAFRRWQWKPGKWKEIDLPIKFTLSQSPPRLPPGAVRIPSLGQ